MGTLNLSQVVKNPVYAGAVNLPLLRDLPPEFCKNTLKRQNRVNIRLRDEDIDTLEVMALDAGMPFQAFLADVIHRFAGGNQAGQE